MHNALTSEQVSDLHKAVLDIVAFINRPDQDDYWIRELGIKLDRALFSVLMVVARYGPIGVVDLATRLGRDHSTISRQTAKLVELELLERRPNPDDRRMRDLAVTGTGDAIATRVAVAREQFAKAALADWSAEDTDGLVKLMRRFADALEQTRLREAELKAGETMT